MSLHVDRGETLVVVGGSGAGNSTSIRQIVGLERPDSWRVLIGGVDIFALNQARMQVGDDQRSEAGGHEP